MGAGAVPSVMLYRVEAVGEAAGGGGLPRLRVFSARCATKQLSSEARPPTAPSSPFYSSHATLLVHLPWTLLLPALLPRLTPLKDDPGSARGPRTPPYRRQVLQPSISLVLDCDAEVFVWTGRASGGYGRWGAHTLAKRLCAARGGYVSGSVVSGGGAVALERETEGCEGAMSR